MVEGLSGDVSWTVVAVLAGAAFLLGRFSRNAVTVAGRVEVKPQESRPPAEIFALLSADTQAQIDRLLADRKIIEAIKVLRAGTSLGLYDAKQVVDWRRAQKG